MSGSYDIPGVDPDAWRQAVALAKQAVETAALDAARAERLADALSHSISEHVDGSPATERETASKEVLLVLSGIVSVLCHKMADTGEGRMLLLVWFISQVLDTFRQLDEG
jgi:hypothetical protein